ncbi:MAG TPA: DUF2723 domain-containing protein [Bacteroidota bacterium]|nr:DUF2723 domain-containing protein [Bacteroidota bacterium]
MEHRTLNRYVAAAVFLVTLGTYVSTMPPTVVFWDVPEHAAASYGIQVQHPPGSPLLVLVMRLASMIPLSHDIAVRMIFVNALISALDVVLLYLIIIRLILLRRKFPETIIEKVFLYGSAVIGSLALTFSTTFWFNSVELETRNTSLLFTALIIWLILVWHEFADEEGSDRYLLMIAYLVGLASGVHIHGMLGFFIAIMVVYFRSYKKTLREFFLSTDVLKFGLVGSLIFFTAYPGVIKWLPSMLDGNVFGYPSQVWVYVAVGIIVAAAYFAYHYSKTRKRLLHLACMAFLFIVLGFSTYTTVFIRANADTPMNENNPSSVGRLVSYLERDQYGDTPLMKRRWSPEPDKVQNFKKYSSDLDYLWQYQINHMYLRYLGWNFIGKAGDAQDDGVRFSQLFGIPFLFGLFGFYYHWKRDPKSALIVTSFFLLTGLVLAFYFNMQEPQPRERDYFFVYSFYGFCIWIGMGVLELTEILRREMNFKRAEIGWFSILAVAFLLIPGNMLRTNYHMMSRKGHYLAWDHSYNLLQSVEKDAILITNGDNDTFPLWYLQDVEGVRRDVRVVCLSLLNTDWYILQLKNNQPYGAKKVPISIPDEQIQGIQPVPYEPRMMDLPVPLNVRQGWDTENQDSAGGRALDTVKFYMPNTLQFGNVKGLRVQDILVYDIIRTSNWQRPVYFAITVQDDSKIGLQNYLEVRGLALKVVPRRTQNPWLALNDDVMHKELFTDVQSPSKDYSPGFRWRALQDPTVHFDENQRGLLRNYRQAFFSLSTYDFNVKNEPKVAANVLDRMEEVMPHKVIPLDFPLKSRIAQIYEMAGEQEKSRSYSQEIVDELEPDAAKGFSETLASQDAYAILLQAYEAVGKYDQALNLLESIRKVYATTRGVDQFVQQQRTRLEALKSARDTVGAKH